jgi:hypothetical protein
MEQFSSPGKVLNSGNCSLSGNPVENPCHERKEQLEGKMSKTCLYIRKHMIKKIRSNLLKTPLRI